MSSGPRTMVDASMYGASTTPKVGYTNGNDGAMPLCHVGIFCLVVPIDDTNCCLSDSQNLRIVGALT